MKDMRSKDEINAEYTQAAAQLGHLYFTIECHRIQVDKILKEIDLQKEVLRKLNNEASERIELDRNSK